jgi:DNA mismatch endonuclease, patch repair protein
MGPVSPSRSENMRRIRGKDTRPEMLVRRLVHSMGYRYRLHAASLPGKPDLVFAGRRRVIFVHGCFWHQHVGCAGSHIPKSNRGYWRPKLERNRARDAEHLKALRTDGWRCLILWECELRDHVVLRGRITRFLG